MPHMRPSRENVALLMPFKLISIVFYNNKKKLKQIVG